jgi:hypothetical protein
MINHLELWLESKATITLAGQSYEGYIYKLCRTYRWLTEKIFIDLYMNLPKVQVDFCKFPFNNINMMTAPKDIGAT